MTITGLAFDPFTGVRNKESTTMSDHDQPVAGNLLDRQFTAATVHQR